MSKYTTRFEKFHNFTMLNEGYVSDDPKDLGGLTICGVSSVYHPIWFAKLWKARSNKALFNSLLEDFYYQNFYNPLYEEIQDEQLAFRLYDLGVNLGVKTAVKFLQIAHNRLFINPRIAVDGVYGTGTSLAICMHPHLDKIYEEYIEVVAAHYRTRKTAKTHLNGWLNRLNKRLP